MVVNVAIKFSDIPRNDTIKALSYAEQLLKTGKWNPDAGQMLLMLQDDPDELKAWLGKLLDEHKSKKQSK